MNWCYKPSRSIPYQDTQALARCRNITREQITIHPNPDFQITVAPATDLLVWWINDIFRRIKQSDEHNRKVVLILPNPCAAYRHIAHLINTHRVNCRHVHIFAMDEYANEKGEIAPAEWEFGFIYSLRKFLWAQIDPQLRMPLTQVHGPTDANIRDYSRMISDAGEADCCYSGPGWTGHLAFIEPDAPEFDAPLEQWKTFGARVCTLSPFTIAQNSLHGFFGKSGDLAIVPPMAATIGPRDVIAAKHRIDINSITVHGTSTSWQRLTTRLAAHGPVTPKLPTSIHQQLRTDFWISEENAANIEPDWNTEY